MTTIVVELEDSIARRLEARARELGLSAPELAASMVSTFTIDDGSRHDDVIDRMGAEMLERYRSVFERLSEADVPAVDDETATMIDAQISRYRGVFDRLAQ